jgi:hypothetical protein
MSARVHQSPIHQSRVNLSKIYARVNLFTMILFMLCGTTVATPKLGSSLPAHPWQGKTLENKLEPSAENSRYWVALYSHDCGDMGEIWNALLAQNLPIQAVNAEETYSAAPKSLETSKNVWRGPSATQFSRALKVRVYPTVLLLEGERIVGLWEPTSGTSFGEYLARMTLN